MSWIQEQGRSLSAIVGKFRRTGDTDGPRGRAYWFRLFRITLNVLVVMAIVTVALLGYLAYTLPLSDEFERKQLQFSTTLVADNGEIFAMRGHFSGEILNLQEIPRYLSQAVVSIEDHRFYDHFGLDPVGMARAAVVNLLAGEVRQGGSTITQQLAKLMFLSSERTFKRKIQEAMIALWLEHRLSKEAILVRYLNKVYLGAGAYGVDGAAQRYFNKSARELTLAESAMLAGLIRAPSYLAPTRNLEAARDRARLVLQTMVTNEFITEATVETADVDKVELAVNPNTQITAGSRYFSDWITTEAKSILGPLSADLTVQTTLNVKLQGLAERTLSRWLNEEGSRRNVEQGAMIVLDHQGAVLAMVGGRNYDESQFNRATQARRQPGSLFKLFVYLAAFDAGMTPDTVMIDQPLRIGNWTPENYGGEYRGEVTLRTAFAESVNSVAVQLSEKIGRGRVIGVARSLGVKSPLKSQPSLALGTSEVTLMEMAAAYGAIAADVKKVAPFGIRSVRGQSRKLYEHKPVQISQRDAALPWKRAEMLDLLITTVDRGTGKAARMPSPVAGKTGTTQDYRDAWFVGFTSDIVVAIWLGNDDNTPTDRVSGGDMPARIWHDFIAAAYQLETVPRQEKDLMASGAPAAPETVKPTQVPAAAAVPEPETEPEQRRSFFANVRGWLRSIVD
jgi:1A family penicillin-binding protein